MINLLILVSILPLIGVGVSLILFMGRRFRTYACSVATVAIVLTAILVLLLERNIPVTVVLPSWRPFWLFNAVLTWQASDVMQPLIWSLVAATASAILVASGSVEKASPLLAATSLGLLTFAMGSLWAANLLTLMVSWAIYDFLTALGHIAAGGSGRAVIRDWGFNSFATLFLWSGALLSDDVGSGEQWASMKLDEVQVTVWIVTVLLRLSLYPLHLSSPGEYVSSSPLRSTLFLSPIIGWGFLIRLVQANGGSVPGGSWLVTPAAVSLALGGFMAWSARSSRGMRAWVGMGVNGAVLLTAVLADNNTALSLITAGCVTWMLGGTVLFLGEGLNLGAGFRPTILWGLPATIGALALAGAPPTMGFLAEVTLLETLVAKARWSWIIAFLVGQTFLGAVVIRRLFSNKSSGTEVSPWGHNVARGVGLAAPALLLIVVGLYPRLLIRDGLVSSMGTLLTKQGSMGWLLWGLPLIGGAFLAWQDEKVQSVVGLWRHALHDLLRLEWLYEALAGAFERGMGMFRTLDEVLGGAGALLWSWILFLIFLLTWSNR